MSEEKRNIFRCAGCKEFVIPKLHTVSTVRMEEDGFKVVFHDECLQKIRDEGNLKKVVDHILSKR